MRRVWGRSYSARLISFTLLAVALAQGIAMFISWYERAHALGEASRTEFYSRVTTIALLLETTPPQLREDILRASSTTFSRFWVSAQPPDDAQAWRHYAWTRLAEPLLTFSIVTDKPVPAPQATVPVASSGETTAKARSPASWSDLPPQSWPLSRPARIMPVDAGYGLGLVVKLANGGWLSAVFSRPSPSADLQSQSLVSLIVTAILLTIIATLTARGITRPMRRLAIAAEALGRGQNVEPLPEAGPDEIRHTAEAFNRMQARLRRFVDDRTRMLAAIGHDLRTPLTSLRLRAEFVPDDDVRERMLNTISEMETMSEATLAFARGESTKEETRLVELSSLVESLCDDLAELGADVRFIEGTKINYCCRADALRRAVRNLIENALRYGTRARVSVARRGDAIALTVEDDGPGIPQEFTEQVFAPFFRMESSRNRQTGGVGLGLSIARTIIRHHGGDIVLANASPGLRAVIELPYPTSLA